MNGADRVNVDRVAGEDLQRVALAIYIMVYKAPDNGEKLVSDTL